MSPQVQQHTGLGLSDAAAADQDAHKEAQEAAVLMKVSEANTGWAGSWQLQSTYMPGRACM